MKRWSPPSSRTSSGPGRTRRWYVLLRMIWAPASRRSSGLRLLTAARVPTGMNAGVSTAPCAVVSRARRAAPSVARRAKVTVAGCSHDEGRVAVRIETIAGAERVLIGLEDQLTSGEGTDQHEQ